MVVHNVGSGLATVFPDLDGKKIGDAFLLARPLVEFTWNMARPPWQTHAFLLRPTLVKTLPLIVRTDHLPPQQPVWDHVQGAREEGEEPPQPSPE